MKFISLSPGDIRTLADDGVLLGFEEEIELDLSDPESLADEIEYLEGSVRMLADGGTSMKSEEEIEEMRDRVGDIVTSDTLDSGSTQWLKLEAAEATLDWTLGEMDGFENIVEVLEDRE